MIGNIMRRSRKAAVVLGCYVIALFWINHVPLSNVSVLANHGDKLAHCGAYAVLAFLLAWTLLPERRGPWRSYVRLLMAVAAYGAADELLQMLVPNRSADWKDWLADLAGGVCGLLAHVALAPSLGRMRQRLRNRWAGGSRIRTSATSEAPAHDSARLELTATECEGSAS